MQSAELQEKPAGPAPPQSVNELPVTPPNSDATPDTQVGTMHIFLAI